jgi:Tfp pilus assembly PilM family ATPase
MSLLDMFQMPAPDVAVEIDHDHVSAARLSWRGSRAVVAAHASEPVPDGLVVPGLAAANIADVQALSRIVAQALSSLGGSRPSRVSLIVPDTVAKVSLLKLDKIPPRASDLQEIVRWQVRKAAPFPIEQAVLSVSPGARSADGAREFVVALSRTDVVQQYEKACQLAGVHAGLVDLSTFAVINSILASASAPAGDWLLVHLTGTYLTLAVVRDKALLFFRNRGESEGTLADLIHQTAMYYEDRLNGGGFARVMIAGGARLPGGADALRVRLEERLHVAVESVDPRGAAALQDRITASADVLDLLAPLVGMLLRERKAAPDAA